MGFQLSPGVVTSEIDLTTVVPAVATSTGAYAGPFAWGPAETPILISDEVNLVNVFGKPPASNASAAIYSDTAVSFLTCANFLAYGNDLRVVRSTNSNDKNATWAGSTNVVSIKNEAVYYDTYHLSDTTATYGAFVARYPGVLGNSLKVSVCDNPTAFNATGTSAWTYAKYFVNAPGTSAYAASVSGTSCNDEMHIVVIDEDGMFTGTKGTVLETFANVSKALDAKDETGNSNYYREVLYRNSKYIYSLTHPYSVAPTSTTSTRLWGTKLSDFATLSDSFYSSAVIVEKGLSGGALNSTVANSDVTAAYDQFKNSEIIDISLIFTGAHSVTVQQHVIDNIAENRKDCVAFISPPLDKTNTGAKASTDITSWRKTDLNRSTSYAVLDSAWKYQYDKYNDTYRWVPANGDIAGLCVRTDATRDPWFSPAGLSRGQLKNVVKLSFNPNKTERDELYKNGVNPIVAFPGEGTILFGDKTLLSKPSAFDRINVRRLFIVLEKAIARAARSSLFEFNDEFTRSQFVSIVEPFLRDVKGRRGIYDYRVVCDTSNNTGEVIDRNEFRGDIYVKPARSINFIQLNFVAVRTGVSFDEVVGKF